MQDAYSTLLKVEKITAQNQRESVNFLSQYENTAVFLLGNLHEHGPDLTAHANSGNFKLIRQNRKIICVFCLTRGGNLLVQSELISPVFEHIIASCKEEPSMIHGVVGEWDFAKDFWQFLKERKIITKETFYGKEINYALDLDDWQSASTQARLLEPNDYQKWRTCITDYLLEQGLPENLSEGEKYEQFIEKCKKFMIWGLFMDSQLISIANLNAKTDHLATVGGVYTAPEWRKRGFAKTLMQQLVFDCKNRLLLKKLIIFTGEEENRSAQRLYESLGCQKVGYMALFFGD